ncbi:RcnB family protein [Pseudomonas capeferrum]|uniref:RcnB family protein n=1 Tax=Pseudomonas capeferrum TaxID=1495066 RepID=UPI0035C0D517
MVATTAHADEAKVEGPEAHNRELKVGDKAPDQYKRDELVVADWKAKGLTPAPEEGVSQWVRMGHQYVLVQITNGVILEIKPES